MCVGAEDGMVLVYNVASKFKSFKKLKGRYTKVTHIDYSDNSQFIQFSNINNELLYFDIETGKRVKEGLIEDDNWATWTSSIGYASKGIPSQRSEIMAVDRRMDKKVLAVGDVHGRVKLFKYPCNIEGILPDNICRSR
jgi:tricorn protease-like protein